MAFLESYAEKGAETVSGEEMNEFSKESIILFDTVYGKSDRNSREYVAKKMNGSLKEQSIEYKIDGRAQAGSGTVVGSDWSRYQNSDL